MIPVKAGIQGFSTTDRFCVHPVGIGAGSAVIPDSTTWMHGAHGNQELSLHSFYQQGGIAAI
jgi:hypothetical protein